MKLYLSSYQIGKDPDKLTALVGKNKRVAVICNAIDSLKGVERKDRVERELKAMSDLGFKPEEIDLKDYFNKPQQIEFTLSKYGLVWIRGGNVFILRKAMARSGFDKAIRSLLDAGIVYAGYSAASCVAGPTLHGVELCDDINLIPEGYPKETLWDGLGLIDYAIAPHYMSDHPESAMVDNVVAYLKEHGISYKTLHDGDAIVVNT